MCVRKWLAALTALVGMVPGAALAEADGSDPRASKPARVSARPASYSEIVDPVYVFYPRGSCREDSIELEVWDRETRVWREHPRHPEVPLETCQLEDAGILFQELRWRCIERQESDLPAAWVVGLDVFNPGVMERCAVDAPTSKDGVEIRITRPAPGESVQNLESRVTVMGDVLIGGESGSLYDVVIALDVSQATGARSGAPDLFGAQLDAAFDLVARLRGRLGGLRVGLITFPNTRLAPGAPGGTGARREIALSDDPVAIDRALRGVRSRSPSSFQSFSSGFGFAVRELAGANPDSGARQGARKVLILAADGRGELPFGPDEAATPRFRTAVDVASQQARAAGVEAHFFALGGVAGEAPRFLADAIGQGGSFRRVPEPRLGTAFLQLVSLPYVSRVEVTDLRTGELASDLQLASDGSFSATIPVEGGRNPVLVTAVTSEGLRGQRELIVEFDDSLIREQLRAAEREHMEERRREGIVEVSPDESEQLSDEIAPKEQR